MSETHYAKRGKKLDHLMLRESLENELIGIKIPVVGNYYRSSEGQAAYQRAKLGDKMVLEFEPTNKFDTNAIVVLAELDRQKPIHIGWVAKDKARQIAKIVSDCLTNENMVKFDINNIILEASVSTRGNSADRMMLTISSVKVKGV